MSAPFSPPPQQRGEECNKMTSVEDLPPSSSGSFTMEDAPHQTTWTPGDKQSHPFDHDRMLQFDPASLTSCYPLMISAVVPRPIALVSSLSPENVGNLAPFSCELPAPIPTFLLSSPPPPP